MKNYIIWLVAIGIGIVDAILLFVFEFVGVDVTDWLWNDVLHTDTNRNLVIPVAIVLGLIFTLVIKLFGAKQVVRADTDLLDEMSSAEGTLSSIGITLTIGAASLLAGASLGPEAALMAASAGIGAYAGSKLKAGSNKQVFILASVGALLVAFIGSMLMVIIPLLLLIQGAKKQKLPLKTLTKPALVVLVAGFLSFITISIINNLTGKSGGDGVFPTLPAFAPHDLIIALLLGFVAGALALCLNWLIKQFSRFAMLLDKQQLPAKDWILSIIFSVVLGGLYLVGGESIEQRR